MPPSGGIAESRNDKSGIRNDRRERLVRTAALLSFRRSAATEKSFHCNIPAHTGKDREFLLVWFHNAQVKISRFARNDKSGIRNDR